MVSSLFLNETGTVGIIYASFTNNVTGSEFLTLLFVIAMITFFFMIFRLPISATAILVLPMLLTFMAFKGDLMVIGGVALIYLGGLFAYNFFIRP